MSEKNYPAIPDPEGVERVYGELLARAPENKMAPRLDAVARAVEILGDVHRAAPVIHITGTNGKTSTARLIEALPRSAHGPLHQPAPRERHRTYLH